MVMLRIELLDAVLFGLTLWDEIALRLADRDEIRRFVVADKLCVFVSRRDNVMLLLRVAVDCGVSDFVELIVSSVVCVGTYAGQSTGVTILEFAGHVTS